MRAGQQMAVIRVKGGGAGGRRGLGAEASKARFNAAAPRVTRPEQSAHARWTRLRLALSFAVLLRLEAKGGRRAACTQAQARILVQLYSCTGATDGRPPTTHATPPRTSTQGVLAWGVATKVTDHE